MDRSQSVLGLGFHAGGDFDFPICANGSKLCSAPSHDYALQDHGKYAQLRLLLWMVPSALLILLWPVRLFQLQGASLKVLPNKTGAFKALLTITLASVESSILILTLTLKPQSDALTIATNVLVFVASIAVWQLSFFEHGRSVKPSTLLTIYLLVSVVFDSFNLVTEYQAYGLSTIVSLLTAAGVLKLILLIVECLNKRSYLREPYNLLPVEQSVSDISRIFLFWVNDQIIKGYSKILSPSDLPGLDDALLARDLRSRMQVAWDKTAKPDADPENESATALIKAWVRCFGGSLFVSVVPRLLMIAFRYSQPILINRTIAYVSEPVTEFSRVTEGITGTQLIFATLFIYVGTAVCWCIYKQGLNRLMVQSRGAFIGLIHARCLTMRDGVYDDAAAVTHMGNDVDNADHLGMMVIELCSNLIEVSIGMFMLWNQLGWWCLTPVVVVLLCSQSSKAIGKQVGPRIMVWQAAKQKRVAITTSMIDYIKDIKIMGMTNSIMAKIQDSRIVDVARGGDFRWIMVYFNLTAYVLILFGPVLTVVFYAVDAQVRGQPVLDPSKAFTAVAIISLVTVPANSLLASFPQLASLLGNMKRIQGYLLKPARVDHRVTVDSSPSQSSQSTNGNGNGQSLEPQRKLSEVAVNLDRVSVKPSSTAKFSLEDVNISISSGSFTVICGAVGTGKTTLARAILGDVIPETGTITVATKRIGYCAQRPWLVNASIKSIVCGPGSDDNIDEEWYNTVIHACGLDQDIKDLSVGDFSPVGSRGGTLSGGQRQRVAIARAVYARPSIIILDDVLSALDAKTEAHVADQLLGKDGVFRRLGTTVILITHATQHLPLADLVVVLAESKVAEQGTWDALRSSTGYISKLQVKEPSALSAAAAAEKPAKNTNTVPPSKDEFLDLSRRTGDTTVYWYYFKSAGMPMLCLFLAFNAGFGVTFTATPYILRAWSEDGGRHTWLYVSLYGLSAVLGFCFIAGVIWSNFIKLNARSSEVLHYTLLKTIMRAPLSYFATTDTGSIVNRFTQDINYIDGRLPFAFLIVVLYTVRFISQILLLIITQAFVTLCAPPLLIVLYFLQRFYLYTSRQLRFLDLEMRAYVYADFLETLEGISVIRSLAWQSHTIDENIKHVDASQKPHYILMTIQQWLNLVLDLLIAGLAVLVVSLAVGLKSTTTGGQIGLALTVFMNLNATLVRLLEQWTEVETSLGAIARIKTLEETLEPEDKEGEDLEPPEEWPQKGGIEFRDVTAAYNSDSMALQSISLKILPGQKVGICGRTGSGKSTFILSLLRLIELKSGSIIIDDLDHSTMPRETIRSRLIAIPQETFVLNDSIRLNLDPSGIKSDEEIITVLKKVQLWDVIESRSSSEGNNENGTSRDEANGTSGDAPKKEEQTDPLEAPLKSSPFSHGQFQLFGLARALLLRARSTILILDEATSNVDAETDALMQRIIREEFSHHTILSVAHRLDTIRDADVIAVLDKGSLVEFGPPEELLSKTGGEAAAAEEKAWFRELWEGSH